jgi:hypothetical protein
MQSALGRHYIIRKFTRIRYLKEKKPREQRPFIPFEIEKQPCQLPHFYEIGLMSENGDVIRPLTKRPDHKNHQIPEGVAYADENK